MRLFKTLAQNSDTEWEFIVTGGDVHGSKVANELIDLLPQSDFVVADKGYNSEAIRNIPKPPQNAGFSWD